MQAALANFCEDPWLQGIKDSIREAKNQVAKFSKRYDFLSGRLAEIDKLVAPLTAPVPGLLTVAEDKFREFLTCPDGAACRLIKARIDLDNAKTGLPYHAIYGWQSEPEKGALAGSGKWHIVRADARIPEKCDRACGVSQLVSSDPDGRMLTSIRKPMG